VNRSPSQPDGKPKLKFKKLKAEIDFRMKPKLKFGKREAERGGKAEILKAASRNLFPLSPFHLSAFSVPRGDAGISAFSFFRAKLSAFCFSL
jgi:hypothetical protein